MAPSTAWPELWIPVVVVGHALAALLLLRSLRSWGRCSTPTATQAATPRRADDDEEGTVQLGAGVDMVVAVADCASASSGHAISVSRPPEQRPLESSTSSSCHGSREATEAATEVQAGQDAAAHVVCMGMMAPGCRLEWTNIGCSYKSRGGRKAVLQVIPRTFIRPVRIISRPL